MRREALQRMLLVRLHIPRPQVLLNAIQPSSSEHVPATSSLLCVLNLAGTAEVPRIGLPSQLGEDGERHVAVALPVEAVQLGDVVEGSEAVASLAVVDEDQVQLFHSQLIRVRWGLAVSLCDSGFEPLLSAVGLECTFTDVAEQEELPSGKRQRLGRDLLAKGRDASHSWQIFNLCRVKRERGAERLGVESPLIIHVACAAAADTLEREEVDEAAEA